MTLIKNFNPAEHFLELADGTKWNSKALKRGKIAVTFVDTNGTPYDIILQNTLYIPSFPMHIFSVQAATEKGSSVCFYPNSAELVTGNGTVFNIKKNGKLYFLDVFTNSNVLIAPCSTSV